MMNQLLIDPAGANCMDRAASGIVKTQADVHLCTLLASIAQAVLFAIDSAANRCGRVPTG
jgi:hypothetical protein